jgi:pilus assembly protein Flp/PilA
MPNLFGNVKRFFKRQDEGAALVEYALLIALIAVACIATITSLSTDLQQFFTAVGTALQGA